MVLIPVQLQSMSRNGGYRLQLDESPLFQQMQAEGVAHIHAHYATHPALVAWLINQLTGITYSVTVHAHDIFTPRDYLQEWVVDRVRLWNEQYLLEAFLSHNRDWEVLGALTGATSVHVLLREDGELAETLRAYFDSALDVAACARRMRP